MRSSSSEEEDPFAGYLSPFAPPKPANGSRLSTTEWEDGPFASELADETDGETPADELEQDEGEAESWESDPEAGLERYEPEDEAEDELELEELETAETDFFAAESLADEQSLAEEAGEYEYEAAPRATGFPSGVSLRVVSGAAASEKDEYWDPNGTGIPLFDTSASQAGTRLSANFTVGELARSGSHRFEKARIDPRLIQCLQAIRDRLGKPVHVNSGYRSWGYNQQLYRGRKQKPTKSRHCSGQAADIRVAGMSGLDVAKAAIDAWGANIAVGIDKGYAHVDVRGQWTKWTYPGLGVAAVRSRALAEIERYRGERRSGSGAPPPPPSRPESPRSHHPTPT